MKTRNWARPAALAAALALAGLLSACGSDSSPTPPTPVTTLPAPVRTLVDSRGFTIGGFPEVVTLPITVSGTGTGTIEIVADWTFASSDIDIIWYSGNCPPASATARTCSIIAATTSVTTKPERLTITNVGAGSYTVGIANFSDRNESGNAQVFFTR